LKNGDDATLGRLHPTIDGRELLLVRRSEPGKNTRLILELLKLELKDTLSDAPITMPDFALGYGHGADMITKLLSFQIDSLFKP
jgi:hypothetical protein